MSYLSGTDALDCAPDVEPDVFDKMKGQKC